MLAECKEAAEDSKTLAENNSTFAFDLYGQLKSTKGNIFFSPYSISTALGMTYGGARGNTEKQMAKTMRFSLGQEKTHPAFAQLEAKLNKIQKKGNVKLNVANSLWPQEDHEFLEEYLGLTKKNYGTSITPLDYRADPERARLTINEWVEDRTQNKIKELIKPNVLDPATRLVLANAIYFKGNWANQFDSKKTKKEPFFLSPTKSIEVDMMTHGKGKDFRYTENRMLQILELPYVGNELSMLILLPKKKDGLNELERKLSIRNLTKWTKKMWEREVNVFLPKFKMSCGFGLADTLKAMGMPDAFDPTKADFSGMDGREHWLYIGAVIHKAFVDVNEEGTEAAAATAVVMELASAMPDPPVEFLADHPFIFLIRENRTGSILFMGRVEDPSASGE